jgi:hypothetical protein
MARVLVPAYHVGVNVIVGVGRTRVHVAANAVAICVILGVVLTGVCECTHGVTIRIILCIKRAIVLAFVKTIAAAQRAAVV